MLFLIRSILHYIKDKICHPIEEKEHDSGRSRLNENYFLLEILENLVDSLNKYTEKNRK